MIHYECDGNHLLCWCPFSLAANQDCSKLEEAIKMLHELKKRAQNDAHIARVQGYKGDLSALGPVIRHVSVNTNND